MTSHPPQPHTIHTLHISVSIKMAACTQVDAAHCYQHCATLITKRHGGTDILLRGGPGHTYIYRKNTFSKIFLGPFPGPRGLLPLIFEFPYSRCISSNFFRRFDLSFRFLLHAPSIHLLLGLVNICFRSKVQD